MSIKQTSKVWETSRHTGTTLLAMLALADHANDDGYCWPGMASIAHKVRVKERQCVNVIQTLEASGEVFIDRGVGRRGTSKYLIVLGLEIAEIAARLITYFDCPKSKAIPTAQAIYEKVQAVAPLIERKEKVQSVTKKVQPLTNKGAMQCRKGAIAIAPEPSLTITEPSKETSLAAEAAEPFIASEPNASEDQGQTPEAGNTKPLEGSPPLDDVPPARARNIMFDKLAALTNTTPAMAASHIVGLIKKLKASGYDETHIDLFAMWWCQDWHSKDIKGRVGQTIPTLGQVGQLFGVAMAWAAKNAPKPAQLTQELTPAQEMALEAQLIKARNERDAEIARRRQEAKTKGETARAAIAAGQV